MTSCIQHMQHAVQQGFYLLFEFLNVHVTSHFEIISCSHDIAYGAFDIAHLVPFDIAYCAFDIAHVVPLTLPTVLLLCIRNQVACMNLTLQIL